MTFHPNDRVLVRERFLATVLSVEDGSVFVRYDGDNARGCVNLRDEDAIRLLDHNYLALEARNRHCADALDSLLPAVAASDPNTRCLATLDPDAWVAYLHGFTCLSSICCSAQLHRMFGNSDFITWYRLAKQED